MNKIKFLLSIFLLVLMCSCSNGLEKAAKRQMQETMKELAKDPSSVQITNVETMFSNDSICILHFKFTGKNGFGGVASYDMEYVYMTVKEKDDNIETKETVIDLDKKESILKKARDSYREKTWETDNNKNWSEDDKKAWYIYFHAQLYMIFNGRDVGDSKQSKYDVDKW